MDWLPYDEVPREELPEWARGSGEVLDGRPFEVTVLPEGLVLARGDTVTAIRWREVLVPIRLDEPRRLLLAAARRPPKPPWFELGGIDVATVERAVRTRVEALGDGGYREQRPERAAMPPDEVLDAVLARRPLPGAVEIPAATPSVRSNVLAGAGVGGLLAVSVAPVALGPLTAGVLGALGGAALLGGLEYRRTRNTGRVLVLTPDAFVGGLDGRSVSAVPWFRVGRFVEGVDDRGESALEVFDPAGALVSRVAGRFFGRSLDVIVAVAEAYRRRASERR